VIYIPYIVFALVALAAIAFAAWPVWREYFRSRGRTEKSATFPGRRSWLDPFLTSAAVALFVLGVGAGIYLVVGQPRLALRAASGLSDRDPNGLVPMLIARVRAHPDDEQAWVYLARIYITAGDADQAAGALGRAVLAARKHGRETPDLDNAYGELMVRAAGGDVPAGAVAAFKAALAADPKNVPARFYLGEAAARNGDRATAQRYWQELLDEVPANMPLHSTLVDRLASIGAAPPAVAGAGGAPDIGAMVAGLAARLKADPNDPAGWMRLIRAYSVLGDTAKARAALATARRTVGTDALVKAALDSEAKELKLE
jgi:cytochrome c-type biogenesis protein CcmH